MLILLIFQWSQKGWDVNLREMFAARKSVCVCEGGGGESGGDGGYGAVYMYYINYGI